MKAEYYAYVTKKGDIWSLKDVVAIYVDGDIVSCNGWWGFWTKEKLQEEKKNLYKVNKNDAFKLIRYVRAPEQDLYDVYKEPSATKVCIWNDIVQNCKWLNGHGLKCVGGNCYCFTAAFIVNGVYIQHSKGSITHIKFEGRKHYGD